MFIRYENISSDDVLIDVRTHTEFRKQRLFPINLPVIDEREYAKLKKFYPSAIFIVTKNIIINRKKIKDRLLKESNQGMFRIVFTCSRGRIRSPLICIYAKLLGLNAKVLSGGVKGQYKEKYKIRGGK